MIAGKLVDIFLERLFILFIQLSLVGNTLSTTDNAFSIKRNVLK